MKNKLFICLLFLFALTFINVNAEDLIYDKLKNDAVRDDISSTYVTNPNGIDFSEVSSDTNGKGLYMIGSTRNDKYPILYYRGNISNNFLIYAGYCWEIIRTTSTGGIKIQYAGIPNNNKCTNEKDALAIGKSEYNSTNDSRKYGWMYNPSDGDVNLYDSSAKTYLDNWFRDNLVDHVKELEDTIWCNDRGMTNNEFNSRIRLEAGNPTLECENIDDSFTVFSKLGNAKLTYPTAIINADEVTYAGEVLKKTQTETFINKSYSYWSMTPYVLSKNMYPNSKGMLNMYTFTYKAGIRPMISLRNTAILLNGDGTPDNPYNAEVEKQYRIIPDENTTVGVEESEATEIINFTPKEKSGYKYLNTKITDLDDNELDIEITNNSFKMPNKDIKLISNYRELKEFYNLTTTNENIEIPEESIEEEQEAKFIINPPHGFKVKEVILLDEDDNELDIELNNSNNTYTFEMPNKNVVVDVTFEELPKYEVEGNNIEISDNEYYENDKVSFKVIERKGYSIKDVYLVDKDNNKLNIKINNSNNTYSFEMPDEDVEVIVEYEPINTINPRTLTSGSSIKIYLIILVLSITYFELKLLWKNKSKFI